MELTLGELSIEEMDAIAQLPRRSKDEIFGPAERWYEEHRDELLSNYSGKQLVVTNDAYYLTFTIGDTHDHALALLFDRYGPLPKEGWPILSIMIKPRP